MTKYFVLGSFLTTFSIFLQGHTKNSGHVDEQTVHEQQPIQPLLLEDAALQAKSSESSTDSISSASSNPTANPNDGLIKASTVKEILDLISNDETYKPRVNFFLGLGPLRSTYDVQFFSTVDAKEVGLKTVLDYEKNRIPSSYSLGGKGRASILMPTNRWFDVVYDFVFIDGSAKGIVSDLNIPLFGIEGISLYGNASVKGYYQTVAGYFSKDISFGFLDKYSSMNFGLGMCYQRLSYSFGNTTTIATATSIGSSNTNIGLSNIISQKTVIQGIGPSISYRSDIFLLPARFNPHQFRFFVSTEISTVFFFAQSNGSADLNFQLKTDTDDFSIDPIGFNWRTSPASFNSMTFEGNVGFKYLYNSFSLQAGYKSYAFLPNFSISDFFGSLSTGAVPDLTFLFLVAPNPGFSGWELSISYDF